MNKELNKTDSGIYYIGKKQEDYAVVKVELLQDLENFYMFCDDGSGQEKAQEVTLKKGTNMIAIPKAYVKDFIKAFESYAGMGIIKKIKQQ